MSEWKFFIMMITAMVIYAILVAFRDWIDGD
jgi:hypothetical protein